jgi:nitric oxide reductase subunit C
MAAQPIEEEFLTMKQLSMAVLIAAALAVVPVHAQQGDPEAGQAIYAAKMCGMCHTLAGESGPMADLGGSLDDVGLRRDAAWLHLYLTEPKAAIADATMPCAALTEQELADLIAYLLTLRGSSGSD